MSVALSDLVHAGYLGELHAMKELPKRASGRWGVSGDVAALVLVQLASYADEDRVAYPSPQTLASALRMSRSSVLDALHCLQEIGMIRDVGTVGNRVKKWLIGPDLVAPSRVQPEQDQVVPVVVPARAQPADDQVVPAVVPVVDPARVHEQGTRNQEGEEEEVEAPLDDGDRITVVRQILPPSWRALTIQAADPGLAVLDELQSAGWSAQDLRAACASLPVPRKHPTGLLVSNLRRLRGQNPQTLTTLGSTTSAPPACPHDIDRRAYCRDCDEASSVPQPVQVAL